VNLCPRSCSDKVATETGSTNHLSGDLAASHRTTYQWAQDENVAVCSHCEGAVAQSQPPGSDVVGFGQSCLDKHRIDRAQDIMRMATSVELPSARLGGFLRTLSRPPLVEYLGLSDDPMSHFFNPVSLECLDGCILIIVWELLQQPTSLSTLALFDWEPEQALFNFAVLMRSAALYRMQHDQVGVLLLCIAVGSNLYRTPTNSSTSHSSVFVNLSRLSSLDA
jgi:hypothetical protein